MNLRPLLFLPPLALGIGGYMWLTTPDPAQKPVPEESVTVVHTCCKSKCRESWLCPNRCNVCVSRFAAGCNLAFGSAPQRLGATTNIRVLPAVHFTADAQDGKLPLVLTQRWSGLSAHLSVAPPAPAGVSIQGTHVPTG